MEGDTEARGVLLPAQGQATRRWILASGAPWRLEAQQIRESSWPAPPPAFPLELSLGLGWLLWVGEDEVTLCSSIRFSSCTWKAQYSTPQLASLPACLKIYA